MADGALSILRMKCVAIVACACIVLAGAATTARAEAERNP